MAYELISSFLTCYREITAKNIIVLKDCDCCTPKSIVNVPVIHLKRHKFYKTLHLQERLFSLANTHFFAGFHSEIQER